MIRQELLELFPMTSNYDEILNDFSDTIYRSDNVNYPKYNIFDDQDGNAFISLACTGIPEESLSVYINDDGLLVIESKIEKDERNYQVKQYPVKSFIRKFQIGNKHEIGTVVYDNGELVVRLNKKEPVRKEIPIMSA